MRVILLIIEYLRSCRAAWAKAKTIEYTGIVVANPWWLGIFETMFWVSRMAGSWNHETCMFQVSREHMGMQLQRYEGRSVMVHHHVSSRSIYGIVWF